MRLQLELHTENTQPSLRSHLQLTSEPLNGTCEIKDRQRRGKKKNREREREKPSTHAGCFLRESQDLMWHLPGSGGIKITQDFTPFFHWKPDPWSIKPLAKNVCLIMFWSNVVSTSLPLQGSRETLCTAMALEVLVSFTNPYFTFRNSAPTAETQQWGRGHFQKTKGQLGLDSVW